MATHAPPSPRPPPTRAARDARVLANRGLVPFVARRFSGRGVEPEDLSQFGMVGLIRAAEGFDPARGYAFATYAYHWIRQSILTGVADTGRTIRTPPWARKEIGRFLAAERAAAAAAAPGPAPSRDELLDGMHLTTKVRRTLASVLAANCVQRAGMPRDVREGPPDAPTALDRLADAESLARLGPALLAIDPVGHALLTARYGLDGAPPRGMKATCRALGLSPWACERLERRALDDLEARVGGDPSPPRHRERP